jgi:predicted GH43/DUF377 family glycosyl hydrolase
MDRKVNGVYFIFHRFFPDIWIDWVEDLNHFFEGKVRWVYGERFIRPRSYSWDSDRIGIAASPIKVSEGFLAVYHGRSKFDSSYRLGVMLLDKENPTTVLKRPEWFILEPKEWYERVGQVNNVVLQRSPSFFN